MISFAILLPPLPPGADVFLQCSFVTVFNTVTTHYQLSVTCCNRKPALQTFALLQRLLSFRSANIFLQQWVKAVHVISLWQHQFGIYLHLMFTFIVWIILFILCWPVALLALVLYPVFWILTLPFRILGIAVDGVLGLLKSIIMLPCRMLQR